MYTPYADASYYTSEYGGNAIPDSELDKALKKASRHIDILTFNRIVGKDVSLLTEYQQDILKECCCELADFEYEYADLIDNVLKSYSVNGVSMTFDESWNLKIQNGVVIRKDIYAKLQGTGLTCLTLWR